MTAQAWKQKLEAQIEPGLAREIDVFEKQILLRKQGKLDETVFAETRLRRGVYGQRYDNGQRHDGVASRQLSFPDADLLKGPGTLWAAPGMMRIKIPYGAVDPDQMLVLADLAEAYSDAICHITTRQDVQLHFVHIEDTPTIMRRLAAVRITTREACGNSVRNVTACQIAGVCKTERFDVSPYAHALADYLLGHPDAQDFGRKFKAAFSGCQDQACGVVSINDIGFIAKTPPDDPTGRGFAMYVGGGLGAVPYGAQLLEPFVPEEEVLPLSLAVCRVFTRLGEKRNRARARLKFVVQKLGLEAFRKEVQQERSKLTPDPRWTAFLATRDSFETPPTAAKPTKSDSPTAPGANSDRFTRWCHSNVAEQKQAGFVTVTLSLPLGDITSDQLRAVAELARVHARGAARLSIEQNIVLRWVEQRSLPAIHGALEKVGLAAPGAGTIADITACPGTDTCKLGIASSRGLAAVLAERFAARTATLDDAVKGLRIKLSGCFNGCGQHHVADIGFWGVSRKVGSYTVPHFQVVLGGQWTENAKSFGLAMGALPSRNILEVTDRITDDFSKQRQPTERFQHYIRRVGRKHIRTLLEDLFVVPDHADDPAYYSDWGDPREFTIGDLGIGECAGEVISSAQFELAASEREIFEAQEQLELENAAAAAEGALQAMLTAAKALTKELHPGLGNSAAEIVEQFRARLFDTKLFFDPFAGGKFGNYLFAAHERAGQPVDLAAARLRIEEAQLFIEAAHSCYGRMTS